MSELFYATMEQLVCLYTGQGNAQPKLDFMHDLKDHYVKIGMLTLMELTMISLLRRKFNSISSITGLTGALELLIRFPIVEHKVVDIAMLYDLVQRCTSFAHVRY